MNFKVSVKKYRYLDKYIYCPFNEIHENVDEKMWKDYNYANGYILVLTKKSPPINLFNTFRSSKLLQVTVRDCRYFLLVILIFARV